MSGSLVRLIKNIHRRGRLPDMKPVRVTITCTVIVGLILAVLFVPLPVSRVTAVGVVQMEPDAWEPVYVDMANNGKAILREVYVKDGQVVRQGEPLARFSNREYDEKLETARLQRSAFETKIAALKSAQPQTKPNTPERTQLEEDLAAAQGELEQAKDMYREFSDKIKQEGIVRARIAGTVMTPPRIDVVDKQWDQKQPLCKVGDPTRLRVLIPVEPADYNLLQENLRPRGKVLPVSVRVPGMGRQFWYGEVTTLPPSEATSIPIELSSKTDGPVPVIPSENPEQLVPQTQQYLVSIELIDPAASIHPGVRAKVKVHCKKRSLGWYIWRSINDTFNLGLL
jgi:multidrug efflux pump subunit AcrA (membrane-fusion protein)